MYSLFCPLCRVLGSHTDGVLEGIFEEHLVEVAVETESIYGAVLMKSGNIDADDILVLYESCDSASDLADVFCRKSICVENRVNNDSVIRAVAHREYSDSEVVKYLGGVLGVGMRRGFRRHSGCRQARCQ